MSWIAECIGKMVISLSICPSIRLCQVLQSSDEVRSQNCILTFGAEEFQNLVLFDSEVKIGCSSATCCSTGRSHTGSIPARHDQVCLEIFVKQDELKRSLTEGPLTRFKRTRKNGENLGPVSFKIKQSWKIFPK